MAVSQYTSASVGKAPGLQNSGAPFLYRRQLPASSFGTFRSEIGIEFPYYAKSVTVKQMASGSNLFVTFQSIRSGNLIQSQHSFPLEAPGESMTFNVACKRIFVHLSSSANSEVAVSAELDYSYGSGSTWQLTGSGISNYP